MTHDPNHIHIPGYLKRAIRKAQDQFITGQRNNLFFKQSVAASLQLQSKTRYHRYFLSISDPLFIRNANRLPNSNFIAAEGPKCADMENFLHDTIYNSNPIHQIVALGDLGALTLVDQAHQDFHDYFLTERTVQYGRFHVNIERVSGCTLSPLIKARLFITDDFDTKQTVHELNVTFLPLKDGKSLDLEHDHSHLIKNELLRLADYGREAPILVHCHAGSGRTGHLIYTLELFNHAGEIFRQRRSDATASKCLNLLSFLRNDARPALVHRHDQLKKAIKNAFILKHFKDSHRTLNEDQPAIAQFML